MDRIKSLNIIEDFFIKYCDPKPEYTGIMAEDLANRLLEQLEDDPYGGLTNEEIEQIMAIPDDVVNDCPDIELDDPTTERRGR